MTTDNTTRRLADIAHKMAALEAEQAQLQGVQAAPWPKRTTMYVRWSHERSYDIGKQLGLTGEALETFTYFGYEIALDIEVRQDGSFTYLACDGHRVLPKES